LFTTCRRLLRCLLVPSTSRRSLLVLKRLFLGAGMSDEGQKAQDYVAGLPSRIRRLAERADKKKAKAMPQPTPFSWIFDRPVDVIA